MEPLGWLLAYLVGFAVVQAALYRYFRRDDPAPDAVPARGVGGGSTTEAWGADHDAAACPNCGADNGPEYTYCRVCLASL